MLREVGQLRGRFGLLAAGQVGASRACFNRNLRPAAVHWWSSVAGGISTHAAGLFLLGQIDNVIVVFRHSQSSRYWWALR
jgi:hypothetical protein